MPWREAPLNQVCKLIILISYTELVNTVCSCTEWNYCNIVHIEQLWRINSINIRNKSIDNYLDLCYIISSWLTVRKTILSKKDCLICDHTTGEVLTTLSNEYNSNNIYSHTHMKHMTHIIIKKKEVSQNLVPWPGYWFATWWILGHKLLGTWTVWIIKEQYRNCID